MRRNDSRTIAHFGFNFLTRADRNVPSIFDDNIVRVGAVRCEKRLGLSLFMLKMIIISHRQARDKDEENSTLRVGSPRTVCLQLLAVSSQSWQIN